jgi:hypothetical protein
VKSGREIMSIKKELLNELSEEQLRKLADTKGIQFELNRIQKKYYQDWEEKDKLVDLMGDHKALTLSEIEKFIERLK